MSRRVQPTVLISFVSFVSHRHKVILKHVHSDKHGFTPINSSWVQINPSHRTKESRRCNARLLLCSCATLHNSLCVPSDTTGFAHPRIHWFVITHCNNTEVGDARKWSACVHCVPSDTLHSTTRYSASVLCVNVVPSTSKYIETVLTDRQPREIKLPEELLFVFFIIVLMFGLL